MDLRNVEDMLLGAPDAWDPLDNLWYDGSEEEMLDIAGDEYEFDQDLFDSPIEATADSWHLLSSRLLTPPEAPLVPSDDQVLIHNCTSSLGEGASPVPSGKNLPCDRCHDRTSRKKHALTLEQTLGHRLP